MSGTDAQRGFIFQSIIAMIECLNRDDWDEVKLEPNTLQDKVDIQLYKNGKILSAIQVKSSINSFQRSDVSGWLKAVKNDASSAQQICLYLVGDSYTDSCNKFIAQNSHEIKSVSFRYLKEICTGYLVEYVKNIGLGDTVPVNDLDLVDSSLFSKILKNSIDTKRLSRKDFEEAFRRALRIKGDNEHLELYIKLMDRFQNQYSDHPSIKMMKPDPLLFPKGIPSISNTERTATEKKQKPKSIKDMIINSWQGSIRKHILFVGEGGIGKTVSMLSLPNEKWFSDFRIPVIYIPLQSLDIYKGELNEYIKNQYVNEIKDINELSQSQWKGHPNIIMLLDGVNEIPMEYRYTAEKHIREWIDRPGVQIITTSRINSFINDRFIEYTLQPLPYFTCKRFLESTGISNKDIPSEDDNIWKIINVPLMLIMYLKIDVVKERTKDNKVSKYLVWKKSDNAAHIVWNYMQVEIYRLINADHTRMLQSATAILAVAPFICYEFVKNGQYYVEQGRFQDIICESILYYSRNAYMMPDQINIFRYRFEKRREDEYLEEGEWKSYFDLLSEQSVMFREKETNDSKGNIDIVYTASHQNFRDALAAIYICENMLSGVRQKIEWESLEETACVADYYVKEYIAEFLADDELIEIWEDHRKRDSVNGSMTWFLLDLIGRKRNYDYREINFSGLNLLDINLHRFFSKRIDICPFPSNAEFFDNTRISFKNIIPEGHTDIVTSVSFSPDGRHIGSSSRDKTVRIWDIESSRVLVLDEIYEEVMCITFSQDGRYIACCTVDGYVCIWELENEELIYDELIGFNGELMFSQDGRLLMCIQEYTIVRILDIETQNRYFLECVGDDVGCVALSSNMRYLACCVGGISSVCWQMVSEDQAKVSEARLDSIMKLNGVKHTFNSNREFIIVVWDLVDGKYIILNGEAALFETIRFSSNGRYLAGSSVQCLIVWAIDKGRHHVLEKSSIYLKEYTFNSDEKYLAYITSKGIVKICELESLLVQSLEGYSENVSSISFSSDGKRLASGADRSVKVTDIEKTNGGDHVLEGSMEWVNCVAQCPDGKHIAVGSNDQTIRIWNLEDYTYRVLEGHKESVRCVKFSLDGLLLASGSNDRTVRVWNLLNEACHEFKVSIGEVLDVEFSSDGKTVYCSGDYGFEVSFDLTKYEDLSNNRTHTTECITVNSRERTSAKISYGGTVLVYAGKQKLTKRLRIINRINCSGANFEKANMNEKDREYLREAGAIV